MKILLQTFRADNKIWLKVMGGMIMEKRQMKRLIVIVAGILLALWGCAVNDLGAYLGIPGVWVTFFVVG